MGSSREEEATASDVQVEMTATGGGAEKPSNSAMLSEDNLPLFVPSHGAATNYHKFSAVFSFLCTIKKRKFKYASGTTLQFGMGLMMNLILLVLCVGIRSRMADPFEVQQKMNYDPAYGSGLDNGIMVSIESLGAYIPAQLPTKYDPENATIVVEYGPVLIDFSPCAMSASTGQPEADDKLGLFMEYFKKEHPTIESSWNLTCHETEEDMLDYISSDYRSNRLGGYIVTNSTDSLSDISQSVEYTFLNHANSGLNHELLFGAVEFDEEEDVSESYRYQGIFGGNHNTESASAAFLSSISLTLQFVFEDAVIKFKTRNYPNPQDPEPQSIASTLEVVKGATSTYQTYDGKDDNFFLLVPMFLIILTSNIIGDITSEIISEKEGKFKVTMSMAGNPPLVYFASWTLYSLTVLVPSIVLITAASILTFQNSSPIACVLFFLVSAFGWVTVGVFISSMFQTVVTGSVMGTMIIWGLSSPSYFILPGENDPTTVHPILGYFLLLLPPSAYAVGVQLLVASEIRLEGPAGIHLTATNEETGMPQESMATSWMSPVDGGFSPSLLEVIICMVFGSLGFLCLSWYLDQIIPDQWGTRKPANFCFKWSYWFEDHSAMQMMNDPEKMAALSHLDSQLKGGGNSGDEEGKRLVPGITTKNLRKVYGTAEKTSDEKDENIVYFFGDTYLQSRKLVESRLRWKKIVDGNAFACFIYLVIGANLIALMFDKQNNSEETQELMDTLNYVFCVVFTLEMLAKWYGMGVRNYFKDGFNCFDFLLVVFSFVEIIFFSGGAGQAAKSAKSAKTIKGAKVAKLTKFARFAKAVRVLRVARLLRWFSYDENSTVVVALDCLNMTAYKDEILSLLGQNGAGKTTFFSMLGGVNQPTSGSALVSGINIFQSVELVKAFVGSCPQHDILFNYFGVEEHLRLFGTLKGIHPADLEGATRYTLSQVGLSKKAKDYVDNLSGGMRRRTSIALACLGDPSILLLDEPSAGVDIVNRAIVWKQLMELKKGRTIIMSTHFMEEAEILGDRVAVLKKGKLHVVGTCIELHNQFGAGYTLVINRPINIDAINLEQATDARDKAVASYIKKASEIYWEEDAKIYAEKAMADWENLVVDISEKKKLDNNEQEGSQSSSKAAPSKGGKKGKRLPRMSLNVAASARNENKNAEARIAPDGRKIPIQIYRVARAAQEVELARDREILAAKLNPEKLEKWLQEFIPESELMGYTEDQAFLEYVLPFDSREKFGEMFAALEKAKEDFGFKQFGVSAPTLQEVFLEISAVDEALESLSLGEGAGFPGTANAATAASMARRKSSAHIVQQRKKSKATRSKSIMMGLSGAAAMANAADRFDPTVPVMDELAKINEADDDGVEEEQAEDVKKPASPVVRRQSVMANVLTVLKGGEKDKDKRAEIPDKKNSRSSTTQKYRKKKEIIWSLHPPQQSVYRQVRAMFVKRYIMAKRNRKALLFQGVLPVLIILMGILFFVIGHEAPEKEFVRFPVNVANYRDNNLRIMVKPEESEETSVFMQYSPDIASHYCGTEGDDQNCVDVVASVRSNVNYDFLFGGSNCLRYDGLYDDECASSASTKSILGMIEENSNFVDGQTYTKTVIYYNTTALSGLPVLVNLYSQSVLAKSLALYENDNMGLHKVDETSGLIEASYQRFPRTEEEMTEASLPAGLNMMAGILIFVTFASITASQCTDAVAERENGCKRQQLISGVNPISYWCANFFFDFTFFMSVPFSSLTLIIYFFEINPYYNQLGDFMRLLAFWSLASIPFAYVCSFVFARSETAQQVMMTVNSIFALIYIFVVFLLEEFAPDSEIATPLRFVGMMCPHVSLGFSIYTFVSSGTLDNDSDEISQDGELPTWILFAEFFVFFILAIAMENTQDKTAKGYAKSKRGTADEVAADSCQPRGKNSQILRDLGENNKFKTFIFVMIILNMIIIFMEMGSEQSTDDTKAMWLGIGNIFFALIFIGEFCVKLGGLGPIGYCSDPFNIFDGLLVALSIVELMMAGDNTFTAARSAKGLKAGKTAKLLKLLRLVKFARLLRLLRFVRFLAVADYDVKVSRNQMLAKEQDEQKRKGSSGRRESIVRMLSTLGGEHVEGSAVDLERRRMTKRMSKSSQSALSIFSDQQPLEEDEVIASEGTRDDAVAVNNLVKRFEPPGRDPITATNDISFGVRQGEIFSLLGPNGAGKSTILNMMTGTLAPTGGEVYVLDKNISTQFNQIKSRIGFCPQFDALVGLMNSFETLTMFGRIKGIPEEDLEPLVNSLVSCIGLSRHAHKMSCTYSGGNKRKLSVAIALIANPDLVFLDEPSTGMDPASLTEVYSCVWMWTRGGKNRSIILTTHSMEEADSLSNRIGIIVNGKLAILGSTQELKSTFGSSYTLEGSITPGNDMSDRAEAMKRLIVKIVPGAQDDGSFDGRIRFELPQEGFLLSEMFNKLEANRDVFKLKDYTISQTTLEQVFIHFAQHQR